MEYIRTVMERAIAVQSIISVHYYEYPIDFFFAGEVHDFWELVYADKGEAIITAGNRELALPAGSVVFAQADGISQHPLRKKRHGQLLYHFLFLRLSVPVYAGGASHSLRQTGTGAHG